MSDLLVWFESGKICATEIKNSPEFFTYEGETFSALDEYLGDADYLRNSLGSLVGFSYMLGEAKEHEDALHEGLIAMSAGAKRSNGMMIFLLKENEPYEIQCVQAIGTNLYRSNTNKFMLTIPDWGFGTLAFNLANSRFPVGIGIPPGQ